VAGVRLFRRVCFAATNNRRNQCIRPKARTTSVAISNIDVGGGAFALVDFLLDDEYTRLIVLNLSDVALNQSRSRLGTRASAVELFEADVTSFTPPRRLGLWHDRAVLHFLTAADDRRGYVVTLRRTLEPGGAVIISTFALDGLPEVQRP
jgi:Methyltransferase domain